MAKSSDALTSDHVMAIGQLVVGVSKIDLLLTDLASVLLGTGIILAIAAIHDKPMANKIDTVKTLAKLRRWPTGDPEIINLLSEAKRVNDYRNTIVHGHWTVDKEGEAYVVRFQTRGKFERPKRAITAEEILQKARQADDIANRLGALRDKLTS